MRGHFPGESCLSCLKSGHLDCILLLLLCSQRNLWWVNLKIVVFEFYLSYPKTLEIKSFFKQMIANSLVWVLRIIAQGVLGQPGWYVLVGWWFSLQVVSASLIPWAVAHQAPLSMGFPRQEHCSGLPFPSPEDLPDPWIKPMSLGSPALLAYSLLTWWILPRVIREAPG